MKTILTIIFLITAALVFSQVTVPKEFTSGTTISASDMNANFQTLEDAVNGIETDLTALQNPARLRVTQNISQSIPSGIQTTVLFNGVDVDTHEAYTTGNGEYIVPFDGFMDLSFTVLFSSASWTAGLRSIAYLFVNDVNVAMKYDYVSGTKSVHDASLVVENYPVSMNDEIRFVVYQDTASAVTLQASSIQNFGSITIEP